MEEEGREREVQQPRRVEEMAGDGCWGGGEGLELAEKEGEGGAPEGRR